MCPDLEHDCDKQIAKPGDLPVKAIRLASKGKCEEKKGFSAAIFREEVHESKF